MVSAEQTVTITQTQTVTASTRQAGTTDAPTSPSDQRDPPSRPQIPPGTPPNSFESPHPDLTYDFGFPHDPYFLPYQVPPPLSLSPSGVPEYKAGAVMDPPTAIIAIIVVAVMYWAFKNGGLSGLMQQYQASKVCSRFCMWLDAELIDCQYSSESISSWVGGGGWIRSREKVLLLV